MIFIDKENGICFRKLEETDLEQLLSLKKESWLTTHKVTICNMQDQKDWFYKLSKDTHAPTSLILIAESDSHPIGCWKISNVDWVSRKADVAWDIFQEYRGKGLGAKLVAAGCQFSSKILNLRRLDAEILENNPASVRCAEKAGFVLEGNKRKAIFKDGSYLDSFVYGLLF